MSSTDRIRMYQIQGSPSARMKFDEILTHLGSYGAYQRRTHLLICLTSIPAAFHILSGAFLKSEPAHRCALPGYDNDTLEIQNNIHQVLVDAFIPRTSEGKYEKCKIYKNIDFDLALEMARNNESLSVNTSRAPGLNTTETETCTSWVYDRSVFQETIVTEFNLVCGDGSKPTIEGVVFMGGVLVGSFLFGTLSDQIGRKKTMVLATFLSLLSGIGVACAPEFYSFTILHFIVGGCDIGMAMCGYVIAMELIGPRFRIPAASLHSFFFTFGYLMFGGLAYLFRDWRKLQFVISLPWALYLTYWWLVPESARWLLSKGREEEAEKILRSAARANKKELPEKLFDVMKEDTEGAKIVSILQLPKEMTKSPKLIMRTLIMFFNWFAVSMVYYGLSLNSGNLGGDVFFNFMVLGLVEFPARAFSLLGHYIGRKPPFVFGNLLGGIACISSLFVVLYFDSNNTALIALSMAGKFGATNGFVVVYYWCVEIYPTVARNGLLGISSVMARVGSMLASPIGDLGKFVPGVPGIVLPPIIFGSVCVIGGLLSLLLPETKGHKLPETVEDCQLIDYSVKGTLDKKVKKSKSAIHLVEDGKTIEVGEDNPALNVKEEEAYL